MPAVASAADPGNATGPGSGARGALESEQPVEPNTVVSINVRWESALPLRQARIRERYGEEPLTSTAAARALAQDDANYLIVLSGFPPLNERQIPGGLDRAFLENAKLVAKGQNSRGPLDVDIAPRGGYWT